MCRPLIAILSPALFSNASPLSSSARDPAARGDNAASRASSALVLKPWRCEAASLESSVRAFSASARACLAREVAVEALLDLLAWVRSCTPWMKWRLAWTAQGFEGWWRRGRGTRGGARNETLSGVKMKSRVLNVRK
ncbi:hypothetical protein GYH30_006433 [Glycine max]|nr:hypothetical protein GYH30_006433 [Glycine max]